MNVYQECGELRKTIRELRVALEELLWISYGAKLSEDDLAVITDCKALVEKCKRIAGSGPP